MEDGFYLSLDFALKVKSLDFPWEHFEVKEGEDDPAEDEEDDGDPGEDKQGPQPFIESGVTCLCSNYLVKITGGDEL